MRLLVVGILCAVVSAGYAYAEAVVVRAGEHENFTRLVMELPDGVSFDLDEKAGTKTVSLTGHTDGFDVSDTFAIIPRDRLVDISATGSDVTLFLSCDCEVRIFSEPPNYVVLDILDGPALAVLPEINRLQSSITLTEQLNSNTAFGYGDLIWSDHSADTADQASVGQPGSRAKGQERDATAIAVDHTRETLLRGLSNAVARRILEARTPAVATTKAAPEPPVPSTIYDSSDNPLPSVTRLGNLRVTNSDDAPSVGNAEDGFFPAVGCIDPEKVAVANWGEPTSIFPQITAARENLFSEHAEPVPENFLTLAKLYIYLGFGVEALNALDHAPHANELHPELYDLAAILTDGYTKNPRTLHRYSDCNSSASLWSLLAHKHVDERLRINEDAVLTALYELPPHLRINIGPAVAERLLSHGKNYSAAAALRNLEQLNRNTHSIAPLPAAGVAGALGDGEEASRLLNKAIAKNDQESPEALVMLIENLIANKQDVPEDLTTLLNAYAFETRAQPIGLDVRATQVILQGVSGNFEEAFAQLNDLAEDFGFQNTTAVRDRLFLALAKSGSDISFLENFYLEFSEAGNSISGQTIRAVAGRLVEAGFPTEALRLIMENSGDPYAPQERIIRARAHLKNDEFLEVIELLSGMDDSASENLLALAQQGIGEYQDAFETFTAAGSGDAALNAAWLSENWSETVPEQSELFGPIVRIADSPGDQIDTDSQMLAKASAAISESTDARKALSKLLEELPAPLSVELPGID